MSLTGANLDPTSDIASNILVSTYTREVDVVQISSDMGNYIRVL